VQGPGGKESRVGGVVFWDVDTQVDFMDPRGSLYVGGAEELRPNLERLTEAARATGVPIVHSTDDHELSDEEIAGEGADFVETFPPHCLRGSPGAERVPETVPAPGALDIAWDGSGFDAGSAREAPEIVVRKKRFDVFSNPATVPLLEALAPATVVVYGVALDICDRYAVEGMLDLGLPDVVVVGDAVAAVVPGTGRQLMADWRRRGVRVLSTDEVVAELTGRR
jgi:nicotinamidase/pyrazinamidase